MKQFSVPMAIADYIPVILFILASIKLSKGLKHAMSKPGFYTYCLGYLMIFTAGFLKATYKLLYAALDLDVAVLSRQFFSNQAFGFLLCGLGLTIGLLGKKKDLSLGIVPTMALVGIMVVGLGAMDANLSYVANRMKKRSALVCFIVSFFCSLCMGYLSTKDFNGAFMNWLAQGINVVGQLLLFIGADILEKAGLENY